MKKRTRKACLVLAFSLIATAFAGGEEPAKAYRLVTPKEDGIIATGINGGGDIVGFEWAEDVPGVVAQKPFLAHGKQITFLPLLSGYTATFPAAVSDQGVVVGRVSKPGSRTKRVFMRSQAFVWDAKTGMRGLGVLKDDWATYACDITSDGRRICGVSIGDDRIRACIWDRDGDTWKGTALPLVTRLGSQVAVMSDDGKRVAAADGALPCLWTEDKSGTWTKETIGEASSLVPRSVNDAGSVVGLRNSNDGLTHAVVWTRDGGYKQLEKPEGYVRSEANAINNAGAVVGMIDGPAGSKTGPKAFVYEQGRLRVLNEGGPFFASATAINDRGQVAGVLEKEED